MLFLLEVLQVEKQGWALPSFTGFYFCLVRKYSKWKDEQGAMHPPETIKIMHFKYTSSRCRNSIKRHCRHKSSQTWIQDHEKEEVRYRVVTEFLRHNNNNNNNNDNNNRATGNRWSVRRWLEQQKKKKKKRRRWWWGWRERERERERERDKRQRKREQQEKETGQHSERRLWGIRTPTPE